MGRELKRVALDFEWPVGTPWRGYINPLYTATQCAHCEGRGDSPEYRHLHNLWYGYEPFKPEDRGSAPFTAETGPVLRFAKRNCGHAPEYYGRSNAAVVREAQRLAKLWNGQWCHHLNVDDVAALIAADRLHDLRKAFVPGKGWQSKDPPHIPTPREVNEWSIRGGIGHDAINCWTVLKAECERLNFPTDCGRCKGAGCFWPSPEAKAAYEAWEQTEPPAGEGYQIWETVSEGSPISPVFSTPEDLAVHMATTKWGADQGTTKAQWLAFIRGPGWAPSMIGSQHGLETGVQAIARAALAE